MSSKKKMIIAISSFAMIVLAAVVAVVAVLAAQSVTVKNKISVQYTATEIAGTVTASYQVANSTSATQIGTKTYTGTETDGATETMSTDLKITLTSANNYVDFIFTFTNTGSSAYTATITLPTLATDANLTQTVTKASGTGVSEATNTAFTIAGGTTAAVTYKVRYTITDVSKNASFTAQEFNWVLN